MLHGAEPDGAPVVREGLHHVLRERGALMHEGVLVPGCFGRQLFLWVPLAAGGEQGGEGDQ